MGNNLVLSQFSEPRLLFQRMWRQLAFEVIVLGEGRSQSFTQAHLRLIEN